MRYAAMIAILAATGIGTVVAFRTLLDLIAPQAASGPGIILATVLIACAATDAADKMLLQHVRRKNNDGE